MSDRWLQCGRAPSPQPLYGGYVPKGGGTGAVAATPVLQGMSPYPTMVQARGRAWRRLCLFVTPNSCKVAKTGLQGWDRKMAQRVVTAGIDVSKQWLDVAVWPGTDTTRVPRTAAAYDELVAWLTEHGVERVALEASGGYEIEVIDALQTHGFQVARLNAQRVRMFAKSLGRLAKNDSVDARTLARAAHTLVDAAPPTRRRDLDPLVEHLAVRRQLRDWITQCANQLEHLTDTRLRRSFQARRAALERDLATLDKKIAALVAAHEDWRDLHARLTTVPGVGAVLAATLIALLPELGQISRRQVASLVGVAPFDDDSGTRHGQRAIEGGREAVRHVLYMATLSAKRHNADIRAFAQRLAGKKPKVIAVACMRKLLTILNAIVRDHATWTARTA